jgi:Ni/Fe-hydrogenase 1 B-type cytochrome subunit
MPQHYAHYKEAHPLSTVVTHYVNLIAMVLLIFTGFMIHYPCFPDMMGVCRGVHVFCGIILVLNLIVRVIMMFTVKSAPTQGTRITDTDIKNWLPQDDNKHQMVPMIKYYLGISKKHPLTAKFNGLQKLAYWFAGLLILFMAWTCFTLWEPTAGLAPSVFCLNLLGGAMAVRIWHWFGMFVMIIFMIAHIYLVAIDGKDTFLAMFARKEHGGFVYDPERHTIVGKDDSIH